VSILNFIYLMSLNLRNKRQIIKKKMREKEAIIKKIILS